MEFGGKQILLTGDARGDKILRGLEEAGLLADEPLTIDVLKVPHHGSDRNVKRQFFEKIVADTYVFSGNGDNGNPDRGTFEMIFAARHKNDEYRLVLTYTIETIDEKWQRYAESRNMDWNFQEDSLQTLFAEKKEKGFKFKVLEGSPLKIELGDQRIAW